MCCHNHFYRALFYLHAAIAFLEFATSFTLIFLIFVSHRDLFFKIKHPDDEDLALLGVKNWIIITALFLVGTIRTVVLFIFLLSLLLIPLPCCYCCFCLTNAGKELCKIYRSIATHRFISFNCNCPCYRARPRLRFQLQLFFIILVSCIRIVTIIFCVIVPHNVTVKSLAIIVAISFVFLILTSILDYYHYRMWWNYKPNFRNIRVPRPTTSLSKKHQRYLPTQLLAENRTGRHGDRLCENNPCTNRELEHILIFHLSDYEPQPRWSELKQMNPNADTYIGFHRTSAESALLISRSEFRRSTKPPQMLGFGIYFARSIENTLGKARFEGAIMAAEVRMSKVKEVTRDQLHTVRNTDSWYPEYNTIYFNHEDDARDEFCVHDESQILNWIMVIDGEFDTKAQDFGMNQEFEDTKCYCI